MDKDAKRIYTERNLIALPSENNLLMKEYSHRMQSSWLTSENFDPALYVN